MKRVLKWIAGLALAAVAGGVIGFLMHFVPGGSSWTATGALVGSLAVFMWLYGRGWW